MKFDLNIFLMKISSRKFWAMLAGLIGAILMILNFDAGSIEQIAGIVTGLGTIVTYLLAETITDVARAKTPTEVVVIQEPTLPEKDL